MINSNELRLGNFILNDNKIVEVIGIGHTHIEIFDKNGETIKPIKCVISDCYPIEITEEILLSLGFINKGEFLVLFNDRSLNIEILLPECSIGLFDTSENYESGKYATPTRFTKYLHDLQNLFFALKGNDMEINL